MKILGNRVLVKKMPEPEQEGFKSVAVQDSFMYQGIVIGLGDGVNVNDGIYMDDTVCFAKYSPDTQEITHGGEQCKIINVADILAVL